MEAPLENNIQASQQDSQSSLPKEYPQLSPDELFNKSMDLFKRHLVHGPYDAFKIKNTVRKLFKFNCPKFTNQHLQLIVARIQLFYRENKHVSNLMTVVRYYHELMIEVERIRPIISSCLPEVYMEAFGVVNSDEKLGYHLRQLKAFYRLWQPFLDSKVMRKIRDYITVSYPEVNLLDLDVKNPVFTKEFNAIKFKKWEMTRVFNPEFHLNPNPFSRRGQYFPRRTNSRRGGYERKNTRIQTIPSPTKLDKDELESNNTNVLSERKESSDRIFSSQDQSQRPNSEEKSINQGSSSIKSFKQEPQTLKVQKLIPNQEKQVKINKNKTIYSKPAENNEKLAKLKEMYAKLMLQKKKKGKKLLNSPQSWQFCQNIFQVLKQKIAIQQVNYLLEQSDEEDEWNYPDMSPTDQNIANRPEKKYSCQFCSSNIEQLNENGKEYLKNIVCFEVTEVKKRRPDWVPRFCYQGPNLSEGMHFLHKDCFSAIIKGIDESKWILE